MLQFWLPPHPWQEQPDTLHLEVTPSKWLTSACGNPLCLPWSFVQTAFPHRGGWGQSPDPSFQAHYLPCKLPAEKQTEVPALVMCQPWNSLGLSLPLLLKSIGDIINQTGIKLDTFSDSWRDLMQGLKQQVATQRFCHKENINLAKHWSQFHSSWLWVQKTF